MVTNIHQTVLLFIIIIIWCNSTVFHMIARDFILVCYYISYCDFIIIRYHCQVSLHATIFDWIYVHNSITNMYDELDWRCSISWECCQMLCTNWNYSLWKKMVHCMFYCKRECVFCQLVLPTYNWVANQGNCLWTSEWQPRKHNLIWSMFSIFFVWIRFFLWNIFCSLFFYYTFIF